MYVCHINVNWGSGKLDTTIELGSETADFFGKDVALVMELNFHMNLRL